MFLALNKFSYELCACCMQFDFQVSFSSRLFRFSTAKNTMLGLMGTQEMHILSLKVGVIHTYTNENESIMLGTVKVVHIFYSSTTNF